MNEFKQWARSNLTLQTDTSPKQVQKQQSTTNLDGSACPPGMPNQTWHHCVGRYIDSNGNIYMGHFKNGLFDGSGQYYWKDGDIYKGKFKNGLKSGEGVYIYPNGDRHVGNWRNNKKNGKGTHISINGDKHVGNWKDGKFHGVGTFIFANGDEYYGDFTHAPSKNIRAWIKSNFSLKDDISKKRVQRKDAIPEKSTLDLMVSVTKPTANGEVTLSINTNADTASLKVNGKEQGGVSNGMYSIKRFTRAGVETSFVVVAMDILGNTQSKTVSVTRSIAESTAQSQETLKPQDLDGVKERNAVAVIIGIENYKNVPKAQFANNDASAFYDYAVKALGVPENKIKLLIDSKAGVIDIERTLKNWLPLNVEKDNTDVYIFYSGHGLPSPDGDTLYILPHGVDIDFLDRTAISQASLLNAIKNANPKSAILFMDSCYSGSTRSGDKLMASARPIIIKKTNKGYPDNFTVLSASSVNQISFSNPNLEHGIFSFYLMKGLEGFADSDKDGKIMVGELNEYLKTSVAKSALSMNKIQTPQTIGNFKKVIVK